MAAAHAEQHIQRFCAAVSDAETQTARQALSDALRASGQLSLLELVRLMDAQLTSEDSSVRARAVTLLSELLPSANLAASASWATPMALFFASKLTDWPTVRGALGGCLFLLRAGSSPRSVLDDGAAGELIAALLRDVHVQSLAAADRILVLECLIAAAELHPSSVSALGQRALEGCVAAVDGEKDPRCLGLAFRLWPRMVALFSPDDAAMRACAEEMHDVMACYYPLAFNPPPGAPADKRHSQTRDSLATDLATALTCTPAFAPFAMPLILGKLAVPTDHGEDVVADTLRTLQAAVRAFPPSVARSHSRAIWRGIRAVILPAPLSDEGDDADASRSKLLVPLAGRSLTTVLHVLASTAGSSASQLVDEILMDSAVVDLCRLLVSAPLPASASVDISVRERANGAFVALSSLLAAIARSSLDAACRVHTALMPAVFAAVPEHGAGVPHRQALALAEHITTAASEAACAAAQASGDADSRLGSPFGHLSGGTLKLFLAATTTTTDVTMMEEEDEALELPVSALGVTGLKSMLLVPPSCDALDADGRVQAAEALTRSALLDRDGRVQTMAASALVAVAKAHASGYALIESTCVPRLLHSVANCTNASECHAAMACIKSLAAAADHSLAPQLSHAVSKNVQATLQGAMGDAVREEILLTQLEAVHALCTSCQFTDFQPLAGFAMWALLSAGSVSSSSVQGGIASAAGAAAAACSTEAQISLATASAQAVLADCPVPEGQLLVAMHIICGLRSGQAVEQASPAQVVPRLIQLPATTSETLAAITALVNKAADGNAIAASVADPGALGLSDIASHVLHVRIRVVGHVAAGLAMRGAPHGISTLPALLLPLLRINAVEHQAIVVATAAALSQPLQDCQLIKHAITKPLAAQRYFTSIIIMILTLTREYTGDARAGGLLALAHVVRSAPRAPLLDMCTALVPLLPECLNLLSSDTFSDAELLSSVLTCTCDILCEDVGRNAAADHAGAVLTALFRLAVPGQSSITMAVRTTALQGIIAAADLPYNKTYPHRKSLLKVLERSVDDPKRSVRAVAVQARTIWEAMPDV